MLEELKILLNETHLTHREIVDRTGLSLSLVTGIKSGKKDNPTISTYQRLRDCLLMAKADRARSAKFTAQAA